MFMTNQKSAAARMLGALNIYFAKTCTAARVQNPSANHARIVWFMLRFVTEYKVFPSIKFFDALVSEEKCFYPMLTVNQFFWIPAEHRNFTNDEGDRE